MTIPVRLQPHVALKRRARIASRLLAWRVPCRGSGTRMMGESARSLNASVRRSRPTSLRAFCPR